MTGDEETLMNRRKKAKKTSRIQNVKDVCFFLFSKEAEVMLVYIVSCQAYELLQSGKNKHFNTLCIICLIAAERLFSFSAPSGSEAEDISERR